MQITRQFHKSEENGEVLSARMMEMIKEAKYVVFFLKDLWKMVDIAQEYCLWWNKKLMR